MSTRYQSCHVIGKPKQRGAGAYPIISQLMELIQRSDVAAFFNYFLHDSEAAYLPIQKPSLNWQRLPREVSKWHYIWVSCI